MASGSKDSSVFTRSGMGDGPSSGLKKDGKILSAYPQDNVHGVDLPDTTGGKMGGGVTNLGHSLRGASAVQDGPGKGK